MKYVVVSFLLGGLASEAQPHAPLDPLRGPPNGNRCDERRDGRCHSSTLPPLRSRYSTISFCTCSTKRNYRTNRAKAPHPAIISPRPTSDTGTKRNNERDTKPGPWSAVPFEQEEHIRSKFEQKQKCGAQQSGICIPLHRDDCICAKRGFECWRSGTEVRCLLLPACKNTLKHRY